MSYFTAGEQWLQVQAGAIARVLKSKKGGMGGFGVLHGSLRGHHVSVTHELCMGKT